jgi:hypothetical protein
LGDAKPLVQDIIHGVDRPGTCKTESYMEKPAFTRTDLSDVRVIMVIMRVPLVESLCQVVMERMPALEYLLSGVPRTYDHALLCPIINTVTFRDPVI